jgi:hypothetical protein
MAEPIDLTGQTFNHLRVVGRARRRSHHGALWLCVCTVRRDDEECGRERVVSTTHLRSGGVKRCSTCAKEAMHEHRQQYARRFVMGAATR